MEYAQRLAHAIHCIKDIGTDGVSDFVGGVVMASDETYDSDIQVFETVEWLIQQDDDTLIFVIYEALGDCLIDIHGRGCNPEDQRKFLIMLLAFTRPIHQKASQKRTWSKSQLKNIPLQFKAMVHEIWPGSCF